VISRALHLSIFEHPAKTDFFNSLLEQFKFEMAFAASIANHNPFALHPEPVEGSKI
jgi:hypothetical protein